MLILYVHKRLGRIRINAGPVDMITHCNTLHLTKAKLTDNDEQDDKKDSHTIWPKLTDLNEISQHLGAGLFILHVMILIQA